MIKDSFFRKVLIIKVFGIVAIFLFLTFMPMASSVNPPPNSPPYGDITSINPNPAIVGTPVSFSGRAKDPENGTIFVTWYFGDGSQATSQGDGWWYLFSASHTYTSTGVFTVTLHIVDMGGKYNDYENTITITNDAPNTADMPSGPTSLNVGESGSFSTSATDPDGHQVQYRFDWGDGISGWTSLGSSGHSDSMSHSWVSAGTYSVKSQAKDEYGLESGWSSGLSVTIIEPNDSPVADADGPYYSEVDESIQLDGSGSYDPDGNIILYEWDLDDDGEYDDAYGEITTYSWSSSGTFPINLRVTDDDGAIDTDDTIVYINEPPIADANGPYYGETGETISLDGSGSYDPDGDIVSYEWDFDDDGQYDDATGVNPSNSWSTPGNYDISLKVTDDYGATDTDDTIVTIIESNLPPYTPNNPTPDNHETDVDPDSIVSWSGGDPNEGDIVMYDVYFGTTSPPSKIVDNQLTESYNPGTLEIYTTYYWYIIAEDSYGETSIGPLWDFTTASENINQPPNKPTISGPVNGKAGEFYDYSIGAIDPDGDDMIYYVEWGDGGVDEGLIHSEGEAGLTHSWSEKKTYEIRVKVTDTGGLESEWSETLTVNIEPISSILFGKINSKTDLDDSISFTGESVISLSFRPFEFISYPIGTEFTVGSDYRGLLGDKFIFGCFELLEIKET